MRWIALAIAAFYALVITCLLLLRWINPPITAVQIERRLEGYRRQQTSVSMQNIAPGLQHAVVAAEDARFFQHHGFDWTEIHNAVEEDIDGKRRRGASTITQQLVKNLFLSTQGSWLRKGIEFTIVPMTELVLSKRRILEIYLNEIEWGPGIYGAEMAAQRYYRIPARRLTREQAIALASILPAPLRRKPGRYTEYESTISDRMAQMGW